MTELEQVIHGLSVPLGKVGYHLPRTISSAITSRDRDDDEPFRIRDRARQGGGARDEKQRARSGDREKAEPRREVFRIGGSVIPPSSRLKAAAQDDAQRGGNASSGEQSDLRRDGAETDSASRNDRIETV